MTVNSYTKPESSVPALFESQIGKLIVTYAYMEKFAMRIVYMVSDIPPDLGELIVRTPRISDTINMIEDVCQYQKIELDLKKTKEIRDRCEDLKKFRDLLAHSNWIKKENGSFAVLKTRGYWNKTDRKTMTHRSKSVVAEAIPVSVEHLLHYNILAGKIILNLMTLFEELSAVMSKPKPSQDK